MIYNPSHINIFKEKAQLWASSFSSVCIFDSNGYKDPYSSLSFMIAVGTEAEYRSNGPVDAVALQEFIDSHPEQIIPGYLTYELAAFFFVPKYVITCKSDIVTILGHNSESIIQAIESTADTSEPINFKGEIKARMSRDEYSYSFNKLKEHILKGDLYEVNLCQEFYVDNAELNSYRAYKELNATSPTPFSCYFKHDDLAIISASPERFLSRKGNIIVSQPIKGTAPRGKTPKEDIENREHLRNDPKEISENVMVVDLVRNDLSVIAEPGTVKVEELLGVYSFKQVHQLISTISCNAREGLSSSELVTKAFPPGSMTGAPKISAMELIKRYEKSNRGLYAGSIGYFNGNHDFDFNVIIRTIIYNLNTRYLSFHVGGAVTSLALEEQEFEECLLKASAINSLLKKNRETDKPLYK